MTACQGFLSGDPAAAPGPAQPSPTDDRAVRALRLRLADEIAIVVEGDVDPGLQKQLWDAVHAGLLGEGFAVVGRPDKPVDLTLKLGTRVDGAVYSIHGSASLTVDSQGAVIDVLTTDTQFLRDGQFCAAMARALVAALLRSPAVIALAERRTPAGANATHVGRVAAAPAPRPAAADVARARTRAQRGTALYNLGRFKDALPEYEDAYLAAADPALLFNIAQCHRKLGNRPQAIDFYKSYLRNAPAAPNRSEVERHIRELSAAAGR